MPGRDNDERVIGETLWVARPDEPAMGNKVGNHQDITHQNCVWGA